MSEPIQFPINGDEAEQLLRTHVLNEDDWDNALGVKPIAKGLSFFLYGTKIMEYRESKKLPPALLFPNDFLQDMGLGDEDKDYSTFLPLRTLFPEEMEQLLDLLRKRKKEFFYDQPARVFGCCNSFNACSDAKACLYAKDPEYLGCLYRRNLEAGRIFYGKNRNV